MTVLEMPASNNDWNAGPVGAEHDYEMNGGAPLPPPPNYEQSSCIQDVWEHSLEDEFAKIRQIVKKFPYIAMDTEFPGVVSRPIGEFRSTPDFHYQVLRVNVDLLKIIQLGLTFMDEDGNVPEGTSTWQFNFQYCLSDEMYAADSIKLLNSSGIQFTRMETEGVDHFHFAELLLTSGIILNDDITFLTFHSGYDFGYLIKCLTVSKLAEDEATFLDSLKIYFPNIYDIKYLMKSCKSLKGGLQEVADQLDVPRIGVQHQAGSDSLLTGMTFFRMKEMFFEDNIDIDKYGGHIYGFEH